MDKKVIVVGAGCAGLSATYTLKKHGIGVIALEAADRIGGRCRNVRKDGFIYNVGAYMTEPQWATTFQYVRELGMESEIVSIKGSRFGFWRDGKVYYILLDAPLKEELQSLPELLRFRGIPFKAYPQIVKLGLAMAKYVKAIGPNHDFSALLELGNTSAAEFTLQHGGQAALDYVMRPFLKTMVLGRPEEVTMSHPIALVSLMRGMCTMNHGMGSINEGLYEKVKDSVRLSTPVQKIIIEDKKVKGVETKDGFLEADQVICATDAFIARMIMPDLPDTIRKPLETCKYSSTFMYEFSLDKKITPKHYFVTMLPGTADPLVAICDAAVEMRLFCTTA
jgi:phytoene dehydrogenase-like protein